MQIKQALSEDIYQLTSDTAKLEAELLLAGCLRQDRVYLKTWPEKVLNTTQIDCYQAALARRRKGEPIAYILGEKEFWSMPIKVDSNTLIPRPETELLVEQALICLPMSACKMLELGTGSGAISIALAVERPEWQVTAVDNSAAALTVAKRNAERQEAEVTWLRSDWFSEVKGSYDLIICNPPYVADNDPHLEQGDVRFEPRSALVSGTDGLDAIRHIIATSPNFLKPNGYLILEHGYNQQTAVLELLKAHQYTNISGLKDDSKQDRLVIARTGKAK